MATFLRLMFQTDSFCFFVQSYRFRNNHIYIILEKSFISLLMFQTYINKVIGRWSIGSEAWGQRVIVHFELLVTTTYIIVYQHFKSIIILYPYLSLKYIISAMFYDPFLLTQLRKTFLQLLGRRCLWRRCCHLLACSSHRWARAGIHQALSEKNIRDKTMMILSRKHFQSLILQWISLHHPQLSQRPRPVRER